MHGSWIVVRPRDEVAALQQGGDGKRKIARVDALPQSAAGLSFLQCFLDFGCGVLEPSGYWCPDCLILY